MPQASFAHRSLYRKWRPQTFAEVTGQGHVVQTLANALAQGRIAHAYLFSGPRGTGKTTVARLLAKSLNCIHGPTAEPCNECGACRRITQGSSLDTTEIDGASNRGIDEIREIRENIRFAPAEGRYRVYIIDEVHMLTAEAFNALLKVLEEPPAHGVFIFATTEPHKVPATVLSRCQRFDFRPLSAAEIRGRLEVVCREEGIQWDDAALAMVAQHADGGLRDALAILDQCIAFSGGQLTAESVEQVVGSAPRAWFHRLAEMMLNRDAAEAFRLVQDLRSRGKDLRQFVRDASRYLRDLLVFAAAPGTQALVEGPAQEQSVLLRHAQGLGLERILAALDTLLRAEQEMRWAANGQLLLELALIRLARPDGGAGEAAPRGTRTAEAQAAATQAPAATAPAQPAAAPAHAAAAPAGSVPRAAAMAPPPPPPASRAAGPDRAKAAPAAGQAPAPPPAQVPPPSAPAAADGNGGLLGRVQSAWPKVIARLREERRAQTAAFLIEGSPVQALPDGTVVVEFPPDRRFHRDSFERGKHRQYVEHIFADLLGQRLKVETRIAGDGPGGEGAPRPEAAGPRDGAASGRGAPVPPDPGPGSPDTRATAPPAEGAGGGRGYPPVVEEALRLFGGEVIAVEKVGDGP